MSTIVAIAGSNSSNSINRTFLDYLSLQINTHTVKDISLIDYELPIYNIDIETERGIPINVQLLKNDIQKADGLMIAVNEHNGTVSSFFKNYIDWLSRADRSFLENKKILLVSTSPGKRGASSALDYTKEVLPRFGGKVVESFSLPSFYENFDTKLNTIKHTDLELGIQEVLSSFIQQLQGN